MILGAHLSIRSGLPRALREAVSSGCEAVQVFGYRRHEFYFDGNLAPQKRAALEEEMRLWREGLSQGPVKAAAVHSRAVAVLSSSDLVVRSSAIEKMKQEVRLAGMLGAAHYVFHLGPFAEGSSAREGLDSACEALKEVFKAVPGPILLLENVPGGGRRMGSSLEELERAARLLESFSGRFGFCLDFAHLWGAGFPVDTPEGARGFFQELEGRIPPDLIRMFHFNNSALPRGSRRDEHRHLWDGHVCPEAYAEAMRRYPGAVGILETPKEGEDPDRKNLDFLRNLIN